MIRLLNFWQKSLSIQLLVSMLLALFVSQFIGLGISWGKFRTDLQATVRNEVGSRAEAVARLIETVPAGLEDEIARVNSTDHSRFWISQERAVSLEPWVQEAFHRFQIPLSSLLNGAAPDSVPVNASYSPLAGENGAAEAFMTGATWTSPAPGGARGAVS